MRAVQVLEAAALEAAEAAAWYEARRAGLGAEFRQVFKGALDTLAEGRISGAPWPGHLGERGVKRLGMKRFPFHVVFVVIGTAAVVLAVAHHRRRPSYWRARVGEVLSGKKP
jgi:toxin ParE1/3/4